MQVTNNNRIKTDIFYINDFHGKTINMERVISAKNDFNNKHLKQPEVDTFTLSSGDIQIGDDKAINQIAVMFQKIIDVKASALGNHECDIQEKFSEISPEISYKLLANNVHIEKDYPYASGVKPSIILEKNGHKYGIIGTSPVDLMSRVKDGTVKKAIKVDSPQETLIDIQTEIDKLQAKGINKIILLSHLGYALDKIVAQNTQGLDVILGGHSHDLVKDIKEGENLLYSKTGEPVIITQAGRDGKHFGILNLEFDLAGIIKKVQNNIGDTKDFPRFAPAKYLFDKFFEDKTIYTTFKTVPPPIHKALLEPNPHGYFFADCIRKDMDVDLAIWPAYAMRGNFEVGEVNDRTLLDISPFKNRLYKVKYSEKDIIDTIKKTGESFKTPSSKPGLFYFSGLKYEMTKNGELLSATYIDKNGIETPIEINNPREDKYYTTVLNDYCTMGNDGMNMLNKPENIIQKYNFDANECVKRILLQSPTPPELKDDNRIKLVD